MKKDTWDLLKMLEDKSQTIQEVFGDSDFLDGEISILWAIIEDGYGVESTDEATEILYAFGCGEITKKKAQSKLRALK